ncbi:MAG: alpha/beta hydrolase-fold protein [candidate division Zixibacteria bacterium]
MRLRFLAIVFGVILTVVFLAGCTDKTKDNPSRSFVTEKGLLWKWPMQFESILTSTIFDATTENPSVRGVHIYTPPGYNWQGQGRPYPVLYLLSPFRANDLYYSEHGLVEIADRLLSEGKIQPMIIVCFDGRSLLGGSFYTNSIRQGNYFTALFRDTSYMDIEWQALNDTFTVDIFSNGMVNRVDQAYSTIQDKGARAIGGVGMGGYGAFSAAIQTDLFSSVSAVNAPLDFDGDDGESGFRTLIDNDISSVWPIDTSFADPATSLIVSASSAFSPHVTVIDSIYYFTSQVSMARTFGYFVGDTLTDDLKSYLPKHQSHAPIDSTGAIDNFIWGLWMAHNIDSLYVNDPEGFATQFNDMPKLLISSDEAKFHYDDQMTAFLNFLNSNGMGTTIQHLTFEGNSEMPATADSYLYDLLEDILIFHSENFDIPEDL